MAPAWNFPTEDAAVRAALRECEQRTRQGCFIRDTSNWRCLAVLRTGDLFEDLRNAVLSDRIALSIETVADVQREVEALNRPCWALEMYHCPIAKRLGWITVKKRTDGDFERHRPGDDQFQIRHPYLNAAGLADVRRLAAGLRVGSSSKIDEACGLY